VHPSLKRLNEQATPDMTGQPGVIRDAAGYVNIVLQCGNPDAVGVNGTSIENVLQLVIDRLYRYQATEFACDENGMAVRALERAKFALEERSHLRRRQGVEGTYHPHRSAGLSGGQVLAAGEARPISYGEEVFGDGHYGEARGHRDPFEDGSSARQREEWVAEQLERSSRNAEAREIQAHLPAEVLRPESFSQVEPAEGEGG